MIWSEELYAVQYAHGWMTGWPDHGRIESRLSSIRHTELIQIDSLIQSSYNTISNALIAIDISSFCCPHNAETAVYELFVIIL